jgi:putative inorganic carbon (hco3(-)) transporter
MLRSIWLLGVYVTFIALGTQAPFILTLGYVWVDTFSPQLVSYIILNDMPVALIMGSLAVGAYILLDRRAAPHLRMVTVLQVSLAVWVTLTTTWAMFPGPAWEKWDWAVKTVLFSAFIPFVIRSRVQIEAFLQVYTLSLAANLIPYGMKMLLSGGGYGRDLGLVAGNSGMSEGSTLAAVCVMTIPLYLFLRRHSVLAPESWVFRQVYSGLAILAGVTTLATFERTGLVGLVTLWGALLLKGRRKILTLTVGLIMAGLAMYIASDAWTSRISTIDDYQTEGSALARILVWRWTLDFARSHPFGGGFGAYLADHIELPDSSTRFAVAFHSVYFEILGEHGWPGLIMFLGLALCSFVALQKSIRQIRAYPELRWCHDLCSTIQVSLFVLLMCGFFIGIAFQPMFHYLFAISISVAEYARRVVVENSQGTTTDRSQANNSGAWRDRAQSSLTSWRTNRAQRNVRDA